MASLEIGTQEDQLAPMSDGSPSLSNSGTSYSHFDVIFSSFKPIFVLPSPKHSSSICIMVLLCADVESVNVFVGAP